MDLLALCVLEACLLGWHLLLLPWILLGLYWELLSRRLLILLSLGGILLGEVFLLADHGRR